MQFKQTRNTKYELNLVKAVRFLGMEDLLNPSSVLDGLTFFWEESQLSTALRLKRFSGDFKSDQVGFRI